MNPNLADDLRASAAKNPERTMLRYRGDSINYATVDAQADRVAAGLHRLGIRRGDRVVFLVGNRPAFVGIHYGILRAGAVSVPLDPAFRAQTLRPYISRVSPRAIIADESVTNEVMTAGPHSAPVFVIGTHPTARPFEEILVDGPAVENAAGLDDLAILVHTSGTAGSPKAVALTHRNLGSNIDQLLDVPQARLLGEDVVYCALPLFHIYALNVLVATAVRQGAGVLLEESFHPMKSISSMTDAGVTVLVGVPPMYAAWLNAPDRVSFDLTRVRFAVSGASALPPGTIAGFKRMFGVEIWEGYGLTEASGAVATTRMADQRAGSVGRPLAGQEVRVVTSTGEDSAVGDPGEVWVRGPNVFKGYWEDEAGTSAAFSGDWLMTGDVGYLDEDGYLWLVDRVRELINISGFTVYPREVEEAIAGHEAVADVAVVGEPDPKQGEKVKAFVVLRPGMIASEADIVVHCTRTLARFKVPSEVDFVDSLPHLATGKVLKRMIR